jgi:hypothetical protein
MGAIRHPERAINLAADILVWAKGSLAAEVLIVQLKEVTRNAEQIVSRFPSGGQCPRAERKFLGL